LLHRNLSSNLLRGTLPTAITRLRSLTFL
jgi:hypothetical protein